MAATLPPIPDPMHGSAATPIAFIRAIVAAYRRYGINPANALRQAQIAPAALDNPDARVTAAQMELISAVAMQELDDEALGWFSRRLPWGSYGMLCRASITSPDLGVAIKRWCRHHRLLTDDILLHLDAQRDVAHVRIEVRRYLGEMHEFCIVTILRYLLGYACWVIDSRIPLLGARFPFPPPPHRSVYPLLFQGPVHFDAEQAGISFDAQYLSLPLRRDEAALQQMLRRALPLTVLQYRRDRLLVQRVRHLLRERLDEGATAETLAERLHLSPRTLHRQLEEEGASVQQLKDEARRERAVDLLNRTNRSIKQIALSTGFRNEKSFSRAFRQWTGDSPTAFRSRVVAATSASEA
ncbi:AraC family transcriptional regulator [Aromatoleum aromaticum]|uniref:Transcriptional regulatory protein n=1 Tax=Aromatoleum aromaticum (strain DSM 19018 / LMG 30748 / EbN1) TaxID=76114 RepID=Q5P1Q5_AROAE|nr:AraC family transcriptional regulator [Aromatoleum aromaticum]NMG54595.1 helix-turn-helix domain-containing protein [Aromatoleum aromaticum]CAI08759.1 putative transcriptional regulatory protein [Aromatoleum aromaticum EbN1]